MAFSRPRERAALQRVREKKAERKLSEKFTKKAKEREVCLLLSTRDFQVLLQKKGGPQTFWV